jgi:hypothetical protein
LTIVIVAAMKADNLLARLLARGDIVSVEHGKLCVQSKSGITIPNDWLSQNTDQLLREAVTQLGQVALFYESYSTGNYGEHHSGGVTLQFGNLLTGEVSYVIFNAALTRARNRKEGKAGSPLQKGQFRVGERSHFCKFWQKSGLTLPPRLSSFHDYMGKLKGLAYIGEYTIDKRLNAASLRPLNITHERLLEAFNIIDLPYKCKTNSRQVPDSCQTRLPDKDFLQSQVHKGLQPFPTACEHNYETSNQGDTGTRRNVIPIDTYRKPEEQTKEEWLMDYGSDDAK